MTGAQAREWLLRGYVTLMVVLMVLPIAIVLLTSLTSDAFLSFPPHGFSVRWYRDVVGDDEWLSAIATSVQVGCLVVVLAMLTGVPAAIDLRHAQGGVATALQTFFLSPLILLCQIPLLNPHPARRLDASLQSLGLDCVGGVD
jgi:ABC-type spermidine/putrescine transport system permease subunit II